MKDIELKKIMLSNGETYGYRYYLGGDKVIILVHGNLASSKHFDTLMEALPEEYTIYAIDMRGFGISTYNKPINSLRDFSEDLKLFVDTLNIEKFDLAGWSTGGGVSMLFSANYGHMVNRLFLIASVGAVGYPSYGKDDEGNKVLLTTKEEIRFDETKIAMLEALEKKDKNYYKKVWDSAIYTHKKPDAKRYEEYIEESLMQKNLIDVYYALASFNISDSFNGISMGTGEISKIKVPTAIIQGKDDILVSSDMAQTIKDGIGENAELMLFDNCGHAPFVDVLDEIVKVIIEF